MSESHPTVKLRGRDKFAKIPVIVQHDVLPKPSWLKKVITLDDLHTIEKVKKTLRDRKLVTVCEEASCPNLVECFAQMTATFMILGDICTRRCTFCDVAHGKPRAVDTQEPQHLVDAVGIMALDYVVITSVDRDDLLDGGAEHFVQCIQELRKNYPTLHIEILVPDFRGRWHKALPILSLAPPDVFNHNIETIQRLYKTIRLGSDYNYSLQVLASFKEAHPHIPTKSGIMLGLGETDEEVLAVMEDLRAHHVDRLTIGQYLQPSSHHAPVMRYVHPDIFSHFKDAGLAMGFNNVQSGPLVRSSYHAKASHTQ